MIIVLGPSGSGKSTLLRRLQALQDGSRDNSEQLANLQLTDRRDLPQPVATVGTNIVYLETSGHGHEDKSKITLQEVGGQMAEIYSNYLNPSLIGLLFVIDCSDLVQLSTAAILLVETVQNVLTNIVEVAMASSTDLPPKFRFAIALNKLDAQLPMAIEVMRSDFLFIDDLIVENDELLEFQVLETSSSSGKGLEEVRKWIESANASDA